MKLDRRIGMTCSHCGQPYDLPWSDTGAPNHLGCVCRDCSSYRSNFDWIASGLVRNVKLVIKTRWINGKEEEYTTYEAEALITELDGEKAWYKVVMPCGNWSSLEPIGRKKDWGKDPFSISIGYWDLEEMYLDSLHN